MFCEVKYRADERKGSPLEAVDARKQQKIFRTAMYYLTEQQLEDVPCRFDVVGIEGTKDHADKECIWRMKMGFKD